MSKVRFRADTTNSFFGNFLYSRVLPKEHFLVRMKDERIGITDTRQTDQTKQNIYTTDKAYDDGDNHEYLKEKNLVSAIILKKTRLIKKDQNKVMTKKIKRKG